MEPKPPLQYSCTVGPDYHPNGWLTVTIIAKDRARRYFLCGVVSVDPKSVTAPQVGVIITVHQNKLEPRVDWETWKPPQPETAQANPS